MKKKTLIMIVTVVLLFLGIGLAAYASFGQRTSFTSIPTNYDWEQLNNDGLDLTEYEEVTKNTPVKLVGEAFDVQDRDYYMFIGRTVYANKYDGAKEDFVSWGAMYAPLGISSKLPLLSPNIIGVTKNRGNKQVKIMNYSYDQTMTSTQYGRGITAGFDIGEMNTADGAITTSNLLVSTSDDSLQSSYIEKQFIKENEMIAYGWAQRSDRTWMPIRLHYYYDVESLKVKLDISFLNTNDSDKYYIGTYASHMDIGGAHKDSKLYSNGEDGIYFNQSKTPVDGIDAQVFFYTGDHNYDNRFGPTQRKLGNMKIFSEIGHWQRMTGTNTSITALYGGSVIKTKPTENWDEIDEKGSFYSKLNHPAFILGWDPMFVKSNEVGTISMDVLVKEKIIERQLQVDYVDGNGEEISLSKNLVLNDSEEYSEAPIEIDDYDFVKVSDQSDPVSGMIKGDIHIVFEYKLKTSSITVHYQDEDGESLRDDKVVEGQVRSNYEETPPPIQGYEYLSTIGKAKGTFTSDPQEVTFVYYKSSYLVHMRQVILSPNSSIAIPESGRFEIWNTKNQTTNDVASKLTYTVNSGTGEVTFSNIEAAKKMGFDFLYLQPVEPSFYQYTGYVLTTDASMAHNAADRTLGNPYLYMSENIEYWLTVYLEPTVDTGVYLNVVNNRLNVYYSNIDHFTVFIDGEKYKEFSVTNKATTESKVIDIPISEIRNKVSVEYQNADGDTVAVYWNNTWDFVHDK